VVVIDTPKLPTKVVGTREEIMQRDPMIQQKVVERIFDFLQGKTVRFRKRPRF
jgi:hypothetical protein